MRPGSSAILAIGESGSGGFGVVLVVVVTAATLAVSGIAFAVVSGAVRTIAVRSGSVALIAGA